MSKQRWLTADQHFGHRKILEFTARPWRTLDEHDRGLLELWNSRVGKEDEVWVVGDFSFHGVTETRWLLENMNGKKHLILGNHDGTMERNGKVGWASVRKVDEIDGVMLRHDAIGWAGRYGWNVGLPKMFCGHVHESWKTCWGRFVNVGVDQWGYAPVRWEEARRCFE